MSTRNKMLDLNPRDGTLLNGEVSTSRAGTLRAPSFRHEYGRSSIVGMRSLTNEMMLQLATRLNKPYFRLVLSTAHDDKILAFCLSFGFAARTCLSTPKKDLAETMS